MASVSLFSLSSTLAIRCWVNWCIPRFSLSRHPTSVIVASCVSSTYHYVLWDAMYSSCLLGSFDCVRHKLIPAVVRKWELNLWRRASILLIRWVGAEIISSSFSELPEVCFLSDSDPLCNMMLISQRHLNPVGRFTRDCANLWKWMFAGL